MRTTKLARPIVMGLSLVMVMELTACGTVFYPERKGTTSGSIDPVVAVADAIGLLFFFIPGVVAFAVDFSNGTIYLSHGRHATLTPEEMKAIAPKGHVDRAALGNLVSKKLALPLDLQAVQVKHFDSESAMLAYWDYQGLSLASL